MPGFGGTAFKGLTQADVVNNLTSTATNFPLSAAQGKVLNDSLTVLDSYSKNQLVAKSDVINNLTSTATDKPGSAAMLKMLNETIGSKSDLSYVSNTSIVAAINSVTGWFQNSNYKFVTGSISMSASATPVQQIQAVIDDITTDSKPTLFMYEVLSSYHLAIQGVLYSGKNAGCGIYYKPDGTILYWMLSNSTITTYKDLTQADVVNNLTSGSTAPVSSGGVYSALVAITSKTITLESGFTLSSWGTITAYQIGKLLIINGSGIKSSSVISTDTLMATVTGVTFAETFTAIGRVDGTSDNIAILTAAKGAGGSVRINNVKYANVNIFFQIIVLTE